MEHLVINLGVLGTPDAHGTALHPPGSAKGLVTVALREDGRWVERRVHPRDLPCVLRALAGRVDVYMTQHRFKERRRIAELLHLDALYVDLDYYRAPGLAGLPASAVLEAAWLTLEDERLPRPSIVVDTTRGLHLIWRHTPVPRAALPRWLACQKRLQAAFGSLKADPRALDAARVLRVVGTRHGRTGGIVKGLTDAGHVWDFDRLADEVLPLGRAELRDLRIARARAGKTPVRPPQGYTYATLWESRLADLQTLLRLRWRSTLPPGQRDTWLFLAGVAMSWLTIPQALPRELFHLARQVGGWEEPEARSRLSCILARVRMAAAGKLGDWCGHDVDPRYRFRTETIIDWLEITPDEQRHMRTLIGQDLVRERHRLAEAARKRRARETSVDRATYLAQVRADDKRGEAQRLRAEGCTLREIAARLGVSPQRVGQLLKPSIPLPGSPGESRGPCGCMVDEVLGEADSVARLR